MDDQELIKRFTERAPGFIRMLGGSYLAVDREAGRCTMQFDISHDFCHSGDIVQGGFVTAMLDAAMSHATFALQGDVVSLSSLEIKTSYLEPTRAGRLRAEGFILKSGYKLAFLEGRLYNEQGVLTATSSTVGKIIRRK